MSSLRAAGMIALGAVLLAACSKPAAPVASASGAAPASSASAAAPGGDVIIAEADLPHPKAGAWETTVDGDTTAPLRFCVNDHPFDLARLHKTCSKFVFHRTLTGIGIDAECGARGVSETMHITASGDFQSQYTSDMRMAFTLHPGEAPHVTETHTQSRYVGPCTAQEQAEADQMAKGE